jgi:aminopeptidase N
MSTYLVAFVISDFAALSKTNSSLRVWSRPNALKQTRYGFEIGEAAIAYFVGLLDEPYQLPKMDMIAVPDFASGAMENWGLITYRESALLYDEAESPTSAQQSLASVIVHECSHMWFGNLVTPAWWSYLWLSEAFARYYQYMAMDKVRSARCFLGHFRLPDT